ncbi:MAG: hypothetical protein AB1348_01950 [Nitrospirota bacterium]
MAKKPRWTTITPEEIKELEKKRSLERKEREGERMVRKPRWTTIKLEEL